MDRLKRQKKSRHGGGLGRAHKLDTPLKTQMNRHKYRRLIPRRRFDTLTEESGEDMKETPVKSNQITVHSSTHGQSELPQRGPSIKKRMRNNQISSGDRKSFFGMSPATRSTIQVTPIQEVVHFDESESPVMTLESITSSSLEPDFNSDDDDDDDDDDEEEEDCFSTASLSSSSLPSPEIFRREVEVATPTFPIKEDILNIDHIKNSTLQDMSHAEDISTHHFLNMSAITDASRIVAEQNNEIMGKLEPETKTQPDSVKTAMRSSPPKVTSKRPLLFKKKVWFKSPIISKTFKIKRISSLMSAGNDPKDSPGLSDPPDQIRFIADENKVGGISGRKEVSSLNLSPNTPVKNNPEKAKFFDFVDDNGMDLYLQKMKDRCLKLTGFTFYSDISADTTSAMT